MASPKKILKLIVVLVSWCSLITESSGEGSATTSSNILEFFIGYIARWSHERITSEIMKEKCPQLYALTSDEFDKQQQKGFLGSLEMLDKLCPTVNNSVLSLPCQGAIGLSSYLCNASAGLRAGNTDWPSPAEAISNSTQLSSPEFLCKSIEDSNLVDKLLAYSKQNSNLKSLNISTNVSMSQEKCVAACNGENHHLCRMILQGLKTVEKWEDLKNHPEDKDPQVADGELPQINENKAQPDQNGTISDVKGAQNQTTDSKSTVSTPQKAENVNASVAQMTESAGNASTGSIPVTQIAPVNPPSVEVKENAAQTTTKPQPETQVSPAADPKGNAESNNAMKSNPDSTEQELEEKLEEEKERKQEENSTYSLNYPSVDEDDSDYGLNAPEDTAVKPPAQETGSQSQGTEYFFDEPEDTHFLVYFIVFVTLTVACYVVYIRRKRFLALLIEGRSGASSRRRSTSRPSSSGYRKLVNNLEEVITSSQSVANSNVIY